MSVVTVMVMQWHESRGTLEHYCPLELLEVLRGAILGTLTYTYAKYKINGIYFIIIYLNKNQSYIFLPSKLLS